MAPKAAKKSAKKSAAKTSAKTATKKAPSQKGKVGGAACSKASRTSGAPGCQNYKKYLAEIVKQQGAPNKYIIGQTAASALNSMTMHLFFGILDATPELMKTQKTLDANVIKTAGSLVLPSRMAPDSKGNKGLTMQAVDKALALYNKK